MDATANIVDEILGLVFRQVVRRHSRSQEEWKHTLSLLAVCRRWRTVALPVVYRHVFIDVTTSAEHMQKMRYEETVDAGLASDIITMTNIDLFEVSGLRPLGKVLTIQFEGITSLYFAFSELSKLLVSAGDMVTPWRNISTLIFPSCWHDKADFDTEVVEPANEIVHGLVTKYTDIFSKTIPNVSVLELCNQSGSALHQIIETRVIESYASHLRSISSFAPLKLELSSTPPLVLTSLSIGLQGKDSPLNSLPRVCSQTLRRLRINGMSDINAWRMFSDRTRAKEEDEDDEAYFVDNIAFPCLTDLNLFYHYSDAVSRQKSVTSSAQSRLAYEGRRLCFPRLERLKLCTFSLNSPFFAISKLPSQLLVLDVEAPANALAALAALDLPIVERLHLHQNPLFEPDDQPPSNLAALNAMLKGHHGTKHTEVIIEGEDGYKLDPWVAQQAKIARFSVDMSLNVADMLEMLQTMPDLTRLSINSLDLSDMPAALKQPWSWNLNEGLSSEAQPHSSKIRTIDIDDCEEAPPASQEQKHALAKYLVSSFPTLLRLEILGLDSAKVSGSLSGCP
ncbi:hypothetical protein EV175_004963 [Coemansia sp. RSA 1933]|nr:hypothetical protein EV175_004963 [Coemansia sp. RSA 1933]